MDKTQKRRLAESIIKRALDGDLKAIRIVMARVIKKGGNNDSSTPLHS